MTHDNAEDEQRVFVENVLLPSTTVWPHQMRALFETGSVGHATTPEDLRDSVQRAMGAHYEPTGLVLHPVDDAVIRIHNLRDDVQAQKDIADAFEIPYWMAGIAGYKAPLRLRVRAWPRKVARRAQRRAQRLLVCLPGVQWGYPTDYLGWTEEPSPRAGRWFVRLGGYRLGAWANPGDDW